jgi:hypothetical protein
MVGGGDDEHIEGNIPLSTMPPSGVWEPDTIFGTKVGASSTEQSPHYNEGDKPLPSQFSFAPIVVEATMTFRGTSPVWFLRNKVATEEAIRQTFSISPYEDAKITRIRAVSHGRRNLIAEKRARSSSFMQSFSGVPSWEEDAPRSLQSNFFSSEIDFLLGLREESRLAMTEGNVKRLSGGDFAMGQTFVLSLNQQLIARGQPQSEIQSQDLSVKNVQTKLPPKPTTTPAPEEAGKTSLDGPTASDDVENDSSDSAATTAVPEAAGDEKMSQYLIIGLVIVAVLGVGIVFSSRSKSAPVHPDEFGGGPPVAWQQPPSPKSLSKSRSMGDLERSGRGQGYKGMRSKSAKSTKSKGGGGKKAIKRSQSMKSVRSSKSAKYTTDTDSDSDSSVSSGSSGSS